MNMLEENLEAALIHAMANLAANGNADTIQFKGFMEILDAISRGETIVIVKE